jgi:hypothetical protein
MLQLLVIRKWKNEEYTIGQLYVNGEKLCNTMEDKDRGLNQNMTKAQIDKVKIKGVTAIPTGTYKLQVSMSPKFKRDLIEIMDVPGYQGVRIHRGNTAKDSEGCILPGLNTAKGMVTKSTEFEIKLTDMVKKDSEAYITII